jgi:hypothetical protein
MIASEWLKTRPIPTRAMFWPFVGLVWLAIAGILSGQTDGSSRGNVRSLLSIDDSSTGSRWLLLRNPAHPAGPGRMVNAPNAGGEDPAFVPGQTVAHRLRGIRPPFPLVIRGGDTLIVEDHNGNANVQLQAVALGPAKLGADFRRG